MSDRKEQSTRWAMMLGSGVLLALAHPQPGWAGLAWAAPFGLLIAAAGRHGFAAFRLAYFGGFAYHLVALRWLIHIPFPVGNVAAWIALSGYVATFQATWVWACWSILHSPPPQQPRTSWLTAVDNLLNQSGLTRALWAFYAATGWTALEMIQARLFTGFPWNLLGSSQYEMIPLIQIAATTGVYGVSFLLVWTATALGLAVLRVFRKPSSRWTWMTDLRLPLLVVLVVTCAGMFRIEPTDPEAPTIRIALIQPSIPQELIWDEAEDDNRFAHVLKLSELALSTKPDLLAWPESAFPQVTQERYEAVTNLVQTHEVDMIFCANDAQPAPTANDLDPTYQYFNAAFLLDRTGTIQSVYHKQRLVVFGEYVPLVRWLPFLKHFTPIEGGFTPGQQPAEFHLDHPIVDLSVLICFEDVFPHLARHHVRNRVNLLLNLTNNGWFGESSAQWQHAAASVFRAVENGVPLVRASNNGLTAWIDERGRMRQWLGQDSGDVYGPGFLVVSATLPDPDRPSTFYHRYGDLFGWICVGMFALALITLLSNRFRRS